MDAISASEVFLPSSTKSPSRLRVLVIDDDPFIIEEIRSILEDSGYSVESAKNGEEGIRVFNLFHPQLVLVDWRMPGMDGLDVCRELRKKRQIKPLHIAIFTQHGHESLLLEAFRLGANDFVAKPISPQALLARVGAVERQVVLQEQLNQKVEEVQYYLDSVEVIILGLDLSGKITLINRKGCDVLGYEEHELLGENWFSRCVPDDVRDQVFAKFNKVISGDASAVDENENPVITRTGGQRLVTWHNTLSFDESGAISGVVSNGEDITEKRRIELESQRLSEQLNQAQKMQSVGVLTGGIAHNFNNILASIIGYTELTQEILSQNKDKQSQQLSLFLGNIHEAGIEAKCLVESLLSFSRGAENEKKTLLLSPIIEDIKRMLEPVLTSSISLTVKADDSLSEVLVDPGHIHQMVTNLCINARDAMGDSGEIELRLHKVRQIDAVCGSCHETFSGRFVELSVADIGEGIKAEVLAVMFEPFFSTKPVGKGTGLGLPMIHGTMHGYKGHILVESEVGGGAKCGTTFRLFFPAN